MATAPVPAPAPAAAGGGSAKSTGTKSETKKVIKKKIIRKVKKPGSGASAAQQAFVAWCATQGIQHEAPDMAGLSAMRHSHQPL